MNDLYQKLLKPTDKQKKQTGEVFTPLELVNEMLDKLPEEVWHNPELTWLDPANGIGNFPVCVFNRLMKGLVNVFPDETIRKEHILTKMLYACELDSKNCYLYKMLMGQTVNLYQGDSLKVDLTKYVWQNGKTVGSFDIVMGNPPYNSGGIRSSSGRMLGTKNETIWPLFVKKYMNILNKNGYLLFVHPLSWLKSSHSVHNLLLEKNIIWLMLVDEAYAKNVINGEIPLSFYLLQNTDTKTTTFVQSIFKRNNIKTESNTMLTKGTNIPLAYHSIFDKLKLFISNGGNGGLVYSMKTVKGTGPKIPINQISPNDLQYYGIDTYTLKQGILVKKMVKAHPDINKHKLIISNKCSFNGVYIDDGKVGLTGNHKFYILGDNLELMKSFLSFKIFKLVEKFTKYNQQFLDKAVFDYIPDIRKLNRDITEEEFYKLIELTHEEIEIVSNF
jgi:hypothetical protein